MRAQHLEFEQEPFIELHPTLRICIDLHHPTLNAVRIELFIPWGVERICEIDALAVTTDFDHLRAAVERPLWFFRVRRTANDAAEVDRAGLPRSGRIGDVVLDELTCSPARYIEEAVVERQIDVGHQRRHGLEALKQRRQ